MSDQTTGPRGGFATSPTTILVVEDEPSFVEALTIGLQREGFVVQVANDGEAALAAFERSVPDLVLLDLLLPKISGIDVCRSIRSRSAVPIIMVTAKGTEVDTVVGLEVGADDYITKPYSMAELVARMRAVLRRAPNQAQGDVGEAPPGAARALQRANESTAVTVGEIVLDSTRHEVTVRGEEVRLPLKEFELLEILLLNSGRVLTRSTLIDSVWGGDYVGDTKTLDVHIKRLRAKVEVDPAEPQIITTIRGVGYRLESPRHKSG